MSDAKWTKTKYDGNASFNIIRDGKDVNEKNVNHVLDNVEGNLQYLFDEVGDLKRDQGAIVLYGAQTDGGTGFDKMLPGTPVYWVQKEDQDTGGYWAPGQIDIRDATDQELSDFFWTWDESSLAQGMVIRRNSEDRTVDVCLYGHIDFEIYTPDDTTYYILGVGDTFEDLDDANTLGGLFVNHADDGTTYPESFTDGSPEPTSLQGGVFYMSDVEAKLAPVSNYPRSMAVIIVDRVSDTYYLNTLVCPDGFGGEKFHIHEEFTIPNQCGYDMLNTNIPDEWYPKVESGTKYINVAMGEIVVDSEVYPYSEITGASGTSDSEYAESLCDTLVTLGVGWISVEDSYFDKDNASSKYYGKIPTDAIWGYTIESVDGFGVDNDSEFWTPPNDTPEDIFLIMNGMPVPRSYYKIDAYGIWWVAAGVEHAPMAELFSPVSGDIPDSRVLQIAYISSLGEFKGKNLTGVESDDLIPFIDQAGTAVIQTKDHYFTEVLVPAMTFNPFGGIQFATDDDVEAADPDKIVTAEKAKHAIKYFGALTNTDQTRSCIEYSGDWADLRTTGFYKVTGATDGPASSIESFPIGMVIANGYDIVQMEGGFSEAYMRKGRPVGSGDTVEWGSWMLITEKKHDPLYLQESTTVDVAHETILPDLVSYSSRTIVSADESTNLVEMPALTGDNKEDGLDFRFVNEMNSGSQASTLVVKLNDQVSGYNGKYIVCPGQACTSANHHMGFGSYTAASDGEVDGVPAYLDVQVTAKFTDPTDKGIVVDDSDFGSGNVRYVKVECEAPQYYGTNSINLEIIRGQWTVTGGSGIWWVLNEDEFATYTASVAGMLDDLLQRVDLIDTDGDSGTEVAKYQDNSKSAIKFTTRQVRTTVTGYDLPAAGTVDFSSSGGIV